MKVGGEVAAYLNKTYGLQMRIGSEMFGDLTVHWYNDVQLLDEISEAFAKFAQDKAYWEMMDHIKPYVLEGSVQDKVVQLYG